MIQGGRDAVLYKPVGVRGSRYVAYTCPQDWGQLQAGHPSKAWSLCQCWPCNGLKCSNDHPDQLSAMLHHCTARHARKTANLLVTGNSHVTSGRLCVSVDHTAVTGDQAFLTPRRLSVVNTSSGSHIRDLAFSSSVLAVRLNRQRCAAGQSTGAQLLCRHRQQHCGRLAAECRGGSTLWLAEAALLSNTFEQAGHIMFVSLRHT